MNRRLSISQNYNCTFLVPFVDMINHGQDRVRFSLISLALETEKPDYYEFSNANLEELLAIK
jgi:hypothetical protein